MARLTATQALRDVLASGWVSDARARDTAIEAMMLDGWDEQAAARAVDAALAKMADHGAGMNDKPPPILFQLCPDGIKPYDRISVRAV